MCGRVQKSLNFFGDCFRYDKKSASSRRCRHLRAVTLRRGAELSGALDNRGVESRSARAAPCPLSPSPRRELSMPTMIGVPGVGTG